MMRNAPTTKTHTDILDNTGHATTVGKSAISTQMLKTKVKNFARAAYNMTKTNEKMLLWSDLAWP
jgi:hypothetical protein